MKKWKFFQSKVNNWENDETSVSAVFFSKLLIKKKYKLIFVKKRLKKCKSLSVLHFFIILCIREPSHERIHQSKKFTPNIPKINNAMTIIDPINKLLSQKPSPRWNPIMICSFAFCSFIFCSSIDITTFFIFSLDTVL